MPGTVPNKIYLYRIVHWDCLPGILANGFLPKRDPRFKPPTRARVFRECAYIRPPLAV